MTRSELFHNTLVVSLPHRFDRRFEVEKELKKHHIDFEFFDAVNGYELNYETQLKKGEEGIRQSHIQIFKKCIEENQPSVMIFEDDVQLLEEFDEELSRALSVLNFEPDLFYLGASHHIEPQHIKENLYRAQFAFTAHAVYVPQKMFKPLIGAIEQNSLPVDVVYAAIQRQINAAAVYPHLAWQKNSYSDIQNEFVDYSFLKTEFVRFRL